MPNLSPWQNALERNLGVLPDKGTVDAGYSSYDNLEYAEGKKLDMYVPDNLLSALDEKEEGEKRYHKSKFQYDEERDIYLCPEGKDLKQWAKRKRKGKPLLVLYRGESCRGCSVKERCTARKARTISRDGREPLLEAMRQKLRTEERKQIYKKRGYTVESFFWTDEVEWQEAVDELAWLGESAG